MRPVAATAHTFFPVFLLACLLLLDDAVHCADQGAVLMYFDAASTQEVLLLALEVWSDSVAADELHSTTRQQQEAAEWGITVHASHGVFTASCCGICRPA